MQKRCIIPMELPPIKLEELPDATRDWLLARAATEKKSPQEVIREVLESTATDQGFPPKQAA